MQAIILKKFNLIFNLKLKELVFYLIDLKQLDNKTFYFAVGF
jgi:hypothetical protein